MGCPLSKCLLKQDDVAPLSFNPKRYSPRPKPKPHRSGVAPANGKVAPKSPNQESWTDKITAETPANQNGSLTLTNQNGYTISTNQAESENSVSNKKSSDFHTQSDVTLSANHGPEHNGSDVALTNGNLSDNSTNENRETGLTKENEPASDQNAKQEDTTDSTNQEEATVPPAFQMPAVEIEKVADGEGCTITLGKFFGTWTAPWPSLPEQIMRAQMFTFDDSDVILCGYAKSGSHWMWEMLHMLMKGKAEHCRTPKERLMLSFSTQEFFDTLPPPRVFNCHAPFFGLPPALRDGINKCKLIYMLRNPKDLAVSYYHHLSKQVDFEYDGTFHGYLDLFLEGKVPGDSWFNYVLGWEQTIKNNPDLPILVLHYEDIKEDTIATLQKVNDFLGLNRDPELLTEIADQCTIDNMKAVDKELKDPDAINVSKTGQNFILRKGVVGDWKNYFTEEDDEKFMRVLDEKLQHSSLKFRYQLENKEDDKREDGDKEENRDLERSDDEKDVSDIEGDVEEMAKERKSSKEVNESEGEREEVDSDKEEKHRSGYDSDRELEELAIERTSSKEKEESDKEVSDSDLSSSAEPKENSISEKEEEGNERKKKTSEGDVYKNESEEEINALKEKKREDDKLEKEEMKDETTWL